MKDIHIAIISLLLVFFPAAYHSQITTEIYSDYDAALGYHDNFNTENNNYGTATQNAAYTIPGTNGGLNVNRSLIHFDLSEIPSNATIINATLNLYALGAAGTLNGHSGSNNHGLIQRVLESWQEDVVTWSTQPLTTEQNEVYTDPSSNALQDYLDIDITSLTQDMLGSSNFGLMLKLADESATNVLLFCSSNHADDSKHPKMVIQYSMPSSITTADNLTENAVVYPNPCHGLVYCTIDSPSSQEKVDVEITTIQGTIAQTLSLAPGRHSIHLDHLSSGIYLVRFHFKNQTILKKINLVNS